MGVEAALLCLVVGITDGDSLRVRCGQTPEQPIRLAEVDAPERRQAFGARSRQALAGLCHQQEARVQPVAVDRYQRTVARVECRGRDASASQVELGMAWVFDRHATDQKLYALQDRARREHVGLWSDPLPVAPWIWRRKGPSDPS